MDESTNPLYVTRPLLPSLDKYEARLRDVWESGWLSNSGPQHRTLEPRIREALKTPNVSLFNNGTIALTVAVQSLRLQGEVVTTPFTFPATTHVLWWNRITPVFADIDYDTMTLDPAATEAAITQRTSGVLGVHVYGIPCDVNGFAEISAQHGLKVVYDAAHAFQTEVDGKGIAAHGDVSMFSFHPTKLFHTGEGGCLAYVDPNLKQRIDLLKNFGIKNEFEVVLPGTNGKMSELQAALGHVVLDEVGLERSRRQAVREQYQEELGGLAGVSIPQMPQGVTDSGQYFVIRIRAEESGCSRDEVYSALRGHQIYARKYFFNLTSDYPSYRTLPSADPSNLPNAHRVANEVLCLPFYGGLTRSDVSRVCEVVRSRVTGS